MAMSPDALRVVLVDDSADLRELISMVIERHAPGWTVVATAADGRSGVDVVRAEQPDLVLLDVAMPVMGGMEALPLIREAAPSATVVMLSGYPFATAGQAALDAGAHAFVEKSDLAQSLVPRLREAVEGRPPEGP
jgi:CheY-like chemotaxis protein